MSTLYAVLYTAVFAFSGVQIARLVFRSLRPVIRLWLGLVIGLIMLMWLPALFSFVLRFTLLSQLLALFTALIAGVLCLLLGRKAVCKATPWRDEKPLLTLLVPLTVLACYLLYTHVILERDGALWVGQSTYGDLSMHLGFISSIAEQGTFPPMYSICPDTLVGYPFLSSSLSSTYYLLGCSLRTSVILPSVYAFILVFAGAYFFFEAWLKRKKLAVFASYVFFVGGGLGFAYFFDLLQFDPSNLTRIFTEFYQTPTNDPSLGLRWVNPIADMLIPQRAILFGWAVLFPCLYLLYRAAFEKRSELFLPLGIMGGALPLIHTHSFLALGVLSAFYLLRSIYKNEGKRQWLGYLWYLLAALAVAAPQLILFTFRQSGSFLKLNWNWDNVSDTFIWFYIKNWGLLFLLLPAAFFMGDSEDRGVYGGALLLWAIAEVIQFQPNPYDNNKLLFITYLLTCGLVSKFMIKAYYRFLYWKKGAAAKIGVRLLACTAGLALFLSGTLTLSRECISEYQLISAEEVAAASFIKENTEPDATFLTYNNHNNAVSVLTGRNIVCGTGSYLYYHGVDYSAREQALPLLFEEPETYFSTLGEEYGIDYVLIGPYERANYDCDYVYFNAHFAVIYEQSGITIYDVSQVPAGSDKPA